ncbi:MAG: thiolase domain-containing protein [Candidatus Bathyarchaeota archaeon]|nr:thiolase domain-containing protein [Candidatus Bathyarchaeota archaeon]MCX8176915.1 thiolase domain-containing protein [Candidatus Bathyarchaeota archaeon]MDW8193398.1 thiolase domain-containing protein [Nitrososphaerota archaeon]
MRKVAVIGIGSSRFGVRNDVNMAELVFEAFKPSIEDAGISPKDVELLAFGSAGAGVWCEEFVPAAVAAEYCGLTGAGIVRCEAACASGSAAFTTAYWAIASGHVNLAVAVGFEKMRQVETSTAIEWIGRAGQYFWEFHNFGVTFPAYYALYARSHMARYGTLEEDLALVAVKNHKYGSMNPIAHLRKRVTLDEVLGSPVVAAPLKLLDCCPISDGAVSIILASEEKVRELGIDTPVWIAGIGYSSAATNMSRRADYVGFESSVKAAGEAYEMAGVGPGDVDVAEVHDCFTIAEIIAYEDLGFCRKGEGPKLLRDGQTEIGGRIPVNIDGGLKSKGHPIGATGCSMIYELTKQLREDAAVEGRQAPMRNYVALAHNVGGTGHYCYVTILRR